MVAARWSLNSPSSAFDCSSSSGWLKVERAIQHLVMIGDLTLSAETSSVRPTCSTVDLAPRRSRVIAAFRSRCQKPPTRRLGLPRVGIVGSATAPLSNLVADTGGATTTGSNSATSSEPGGCRCRSGRGRRRLRPPGCPRDPPACKSLPIQCHQLPPSGQRSHTVHRLRSKANASCVHLRNRRSHAS